MFNNHLHFPQWNCSRMVLLLAVLLCGTAAYAQTDDVPKAVGFTNYKVYTDTAVAEVYKTLVNINDLGDDGKPNTSTVYKLGKNTYYDYSYVTQYGANVTKTATTCREILIDLNGGNPNGDGKYVNEILITLKNKNGYFFKTKKPDIYTREIQNTKVVYDNSEPFIITAYTKELHPGRCWKKSFYDSDGKMPNGTQINLPVSSDYAHKAAIDYFADSTRLLVTSTNRDNVKGYGHFNNETAYSYILITYFGEDELEIGDLRILTDKPTITYNASVVDSIGDDASTKYETSTNGKPVVLRVESTEDFGLPVSADLTFQKDTSEAEGFRCVKLLNKPKNKPGVSYYQYIPPMGINTTVNLADATAPGNTVSVNVNTSNALKINKVFDGTVSYEGGVGDAFQWNALKDMTEYGGYSAGQNGDVIVDMAGMYNVKAIRAVYPSAYFDPPVVVYGTTYSGQAGETLEWQEIGKIDKEYGDLGMDNSSNLSVQWLDLSSDKQFRALKFSFTAGKAFHEIAIFGDKQNGAEASTPEVKVVKVVVNATKAHIKFMATDTNSPWISYKVEWAKVDNNTTTSDFSDEYSIGSVESFSMISANAFDIACDNLYKSSWYYYRITVTNCFGKTATHKGWFQTKEEDSFIDYNAGDPYNVIHVLGGTYSAEAFKTINDAIENPSLTTKSKSYGALMYDMSDVTFESYDNDGKRIYYTLTNEHNPNTFFIVSDGGSSSINSDQTNLITKSNDGSYFYDHDVVLQDKYEVYNGGLTVKGQSRSVYDKTNLGYSYKTPVCKYTRTTKAPWGTVCLPFAVDLLKYVDGYQSYTSHEARFWANPQAVKGSNILRYWWPQYVRASAESGENAVDTVIFNNGVNASSPQSKEWLKQRDVSNWTDDDYTNCTTERPQYITYKNSDSFQDDVFTGRRVAIVQFMMDKKGYKCSDGNTYTTGDVMPVTIKTELMPTLYFSDATSRGDEYRIGNGYGTYRLNDEAPEAADEDVTTCYLTGTLAHSTIPAGNYYLPATADTEGETAYDGMSLHKATKDKSLPPFRAYINIPNSDAQNFTKKLAIVFTYLVTNDKGETDVIKRPATDEELSGIFNIYSINGQVVRRNSTSALGLPAGIYIINGKKVLVK